MSAHGVVFVEILTEAKDCGRSVFNAVTVRCGFIYVGMMDDIISMDGSRSDIRDGVT